MKVPYSWLTEKLKLKPPVAELASLLHQRGLLVEEIEYPKEEIKGVIAAKILELSPHPNADKLKIAKVETGKELFEIVTAATNVYPGMPVALALCGAKLSGGQKIEKTKLRGIESLGMLCSAKELNLDLKDLPEEQRVGVMEIDKSIPPGTDLTELYLLNDPVLVFEIFANRPDLLSVEGIVREAAAALKQELPPRESPEIPELEADINELVKLEVEDLELCPRYLGKIYRELRIAPSPPWLYFRLLKAGLRPVNNLVDVTNYVLLELGQPLHAFDYRKIAGQKIIVRKAKAGEKIITIDESEIELSPEMLVIADSEKPVAVAGVMGGKDSEIASDTQTIFLECAQFSPVSIRRTSQKLALKSESQRRFEKGVDFYRLPPAVQRVSELLWELGAAKPVKGLLEIAAQAPEQKIITLRPGRVAQILGKEYSPEECRGILKLMACKVEQKAESLQVEVPTFRADLSREIDLIEEIARVSGYNLIPETLPQGVTLLGKPEVKEAGEEKLKELLTRLGFTEAITYSLCSPSVFAQYKLEEKTALKVLNPLVEEQKQFRTFIFPGLISAASRNFALGAESLSLFELARIYQKGEGETAAETTHLAMVACGKGVDFFALKGALERLFCELKLTAELDFLPQSFPFLHPGISAKILLGEEELGFIGQLHPETARKLEIKTPLWLAEFNSHQLLFKQESLQYQAIPRFPGIARDLALVVEESISCRSLSRSIKAAGGELLVELSCFDQYQGSQIAAGNKSLAFNLLFKSPERTLKDEEVESRIKEILAQVAQKYRAKLRE